MTHTEADWLGDFEPGSPEWQAARAGGLGGSEIAAVVGLSPFESRFSLWHRKAGLVGPADEIPEMEWGKRLEDAIANKYADCHLGVRVGYAGMWRNRQRPYQLGQPDRWLSTDELLEIKTARYDDEWGEPGTSEIPVHYKCQCLWYLDCLGLRVCHVAVLITGSDYREYVVEYDPAEARVLRDAAEAFMATLQRDERPAIDAHEATYQTVRELHPDIDEGTRFDAPEHIAEPYLLALAGYQEAAAEKRRAAAALCDAMGTAHKATYRGDEIATRVAKGDHPPHIRAVNGAATLRSAP